MYKNTEIFLLHFIDFIFTCVKVFEIFLDFEQCGSATTKYIYSSTIKYNFDKLVLYFILHYISQGYFVASVSICNIWPCNVAEVLAAEG